MEGASRGRIVFAILLAAGLVVAVVIVVATSRGEEDVAAAPEACLRDWNADPVSRERGRHVRNFHEYDSAQVGPSAAAGCTVVFPRSALDPEREYAGFAYTGSRLASSCWPAG